MYYICDVKQHQLFLTSNCRKSFAKISENHIIYHYKTNHWPLSHIKQMLFSICVHALHTCHNSFVHVGGER